MARFVGRCMALAAGVFFCIVSPQSFEVLEGLNFFRRFSALHLLWIIWVGDMLLQLLPAKRDIALGSKKLFKQYFTPAHVKHELEALKSISFPLPVLLTRS